MEIEYPENGPVALALGRNYPTIGAFYQAIEDVFPQFSADITGNNQIKSASLSLGPIKTLNDALDAIKKIKRQGEGTADNPASGSFAGDLAHYYKFAEIWHEKELIQKDGKWVYEGPDITFPGARDLFPMSPIPAGGYVNPAAPVQQALDDFNNRFKSMLDNLQNAWGAGGQSSLSAAVADMRKLGQLATNLMMMPLPDGSGGVYGPNFVV